MRLLLVILAAAATALAAVFGALGGLIEVAADNSDARAMASLPLAFALPAAIAAGLFWGATWLLDRRRGRGPG